MFLGQDNQVLNQDKHKQVVFLFFGFVFVLLIMIVVVFFAIRIWSQRTIKQDEIEISAKLEAGKTATTTHLKNANDNIKDENIKKDKYYYLPDVQAEDLMFGEFYNEQNVDDIVLNFEDYKLPINVKVDVSNYYDVSRKIDLEKINNELNNNGFTIISNPFVDNDFYSVLTELQKNKIPIVITSDLLNYYYQNVLQRNYKMIESNVFFDNLWNINNALYESAKKRYERLNRQNKMVNDPFLEASRLETAYLAVILKLLSPTEEQINQMKLSEEGTFTKKDAESFSIQLPSYLQADVLKEIDLIRNHSDKKNEERSPVLKYVRDYSYFQIPDIYQKNTRLNNFYLASKWIHSILPLYYRGSKCEKCLLDKEDWRINVLSTFLLTQDFSLNQDIKNEWAQIYKIFSFFNGLREELTYIDFDKSIKNNFNDDYDLEKEFFNKDLGVIDNKISQVQVNIISNLKQNKIKGGYDYNATSTRSKIGMRMLSDSYNPNEYIFKQLTFPNVEEYLGNEDDVKNIKTNCTVKKKNFRCNGSNLDILNLLKKQDDNVFASSTDYAFYNQQSDNLKLWMDKFDKYTWHDSNYWSTLYLYKSYIKNTLDKLPVFMEQDLWKKRIEEFLFGSLTCTQTDIDKLQLKRNMQMIGQAWLSVDNDSIEYGYIEPNIIFAKEMRANLKMLNDLFYNIGIIDKVDYVKTDLNESVDIMGRVVDIIEKELAGDDLNEEDHEFMYNFINKYEVVDKKEKIVNSKYALTQQVDGTKLLLLIYKKNGKKILAGGPIYNYEEIKN